jgi:hypothetical protein
MADRTQKNVHESPVPGATTPLGIAAEGAASRSWDPYDVWLRRVKQPRDSRPARAAAMAARAATPTVSEPGASPRLAVPHPR